MARILIVDDQKVILKTLEAVLVKNGHTVTACSDGFDAVEKVTQQTFELVITDIVMPKGVSGYDLIKTIRKNPKTAELGVILLSGKREKKDVKRGMEAGADDYIVKPIDEEILKAKVAWVLERKSKTPASAFVDLAISEPAKFTADLKVVGISELGMTLTSPQPLNLNSKITIDSGLFADVGIEVPILRVTACTADEKFGFFIRLQFVGLSEKSLQPLRVWIRSRSLKKSA